MLVAIHYGGESWEVTALEGRFEGSVIARVDGIVLCDAVFTKQGIITGEPRAVWGAVLEDRVASDRPTVFGLGINQPFDTRPNRVALPHDRGWVDMVTRREISTAHLVTVIDDTVYFWRHSK